MPPLGDAKFPRLRHGRDQHVDSSLLPKCLRLTGMQGAGKCRTDLTRSSSKSLASPPMKPILFVIQDRSFYHQR